MTGEQLFLNNFFVCARVRYQNGELPESKYRDLFVHINKDTTPSVELLTECFPKMAEALAEFAAERQLVRWDRETVEAFCLARAEALIKAEGQ